MDSVRIKQKALELGFHLVGIAPATRFPEADYYWQWLDRGFAADMTYLARNVEKRENAQALFPPARSVIVCGMSYHSTVSSFQDSYDSSRGFITRYARGDDYHTVLKQALFSLAEFMQQESSHRLEVKVCVDTVPILERLYGYYAGLGWIGKNTTLINPHYGSWFFLGEILTSLELDYDVPLADQCGTCTRCLDACPTNALVAPRLLDARRCVSYLTIENTGEIPAHFRPHLGNRVFGCDRCQEVCPWNAKALAPNVLEFLPRQQLDSPTFEWLCTLTSEEFKRTFNNSPILRTKLRGLLRNTAVAIGNSGNPEYLPILENISTEADPLVQPHITWALEQLG